MAISFQNLNPIKLRIINAAANRTQQMKQDYMKQMKQMIFVCFQQMKSTSQHPNFSKKSPTLGGESFISITQGCHGCANAVNGINEEFIKKTCFFYLALIMTLDLYCYMNKMHNIIC